MRIGSAVLYVVCRVCGAGGVQAVGVGSVWVVCSTGSTGTGHPSTSTHTIHNGTYTSRFIYYRRGRGGSSARCQRQTPCCIVKGGEEGWVKRPDGAVCRLSVLWQVWVVVGGVLGLGVSDRLWDVRKGKAQRDFANTLTGTLSTHQKHIHDAID